MNRKKIARELKEIHLSVWPYLEADEDDNYLDVRLRQFNGNYELLTGDSQYDTDHRGLWGYSSLTEDPSDMTMADYLAIAEDLIEQVKEDKATSFMAIVDSIDLVLNSH